MVIDVCLAHLWLPSLSKSNAWGMLVLRIDSFLYIINVLSVRGKLWNLKFFVNLYRDLSYVEIILKLFYGSSGRPP